MTDTHWRERKDSRKVSVVKGRMLSHSDDIYLRRMPVFGVFFAHHYNPTVMGIEIVECVTAGQRRRFIDFQWEIYKGDPHWVPPLISDRTRFFDKTRNLFFKHSDAALFLALRDGRPAGTIAAIHNTRHLAKWHDGAGFFGAFECVDDQAVASALFDAARNWLRPRGLTTLRGPTTLSLNDECGLLIEGFDSEPMVLMTYNPRYYAGLIEGYGFQRAQDLYAWWITPEGGQSVVDGRFGRIAAKAAARGKFTIRHVNLKRVREEFQHVKEVLYSGPWEQNWGHVTPTDEELEHLVLELAKIADEELVLIAEIDGQAVGVAAAIPNVNTPLRLAYPRPGVPELWTLAKFFWYRRKNVKSMRFLVLGVLASHRMSGIDSMLAVRMNALVHKKGFIGTECSWVLESNDAMNRIAELGSGKIYKRYRIYDIAIGDS
jgi:hypothetical protein